jgi:hypothetical protein
VLETVPLYLLYEASILLASFLGRPRRGAREEGTVEGGSAESAPASNPDEPAEPTVQDMIDHVDPRL